MINKVRVNGDYTVYPADAKDGLYIEWTGAGSIHLPDPEAVPLGTKITVKSPRLDDLYVYVNISSEVEILGIRVNQIGWEKVFEIENFKEK